MEIEVLLLPLAILIVFITVHTGCEEVRDFGNQPTIIETDRLPTLKNGRSIDTALMPSVGNGHIASVVYNDTMYMNGIYNGQLGRSHRARIPAEINMRVKVLNEENKQVYRQYRLDMKDGYWEENITVEEFRVTQRVYAHQYYTRLLVTEIYAQRQGAATGNLMVYLNKGRGDNSSDINFNPPTSFNGGNWRSQGTTVESEVPGGHRSVVYTFWSVVPPVIHIPSYQSSIRYTYIMAVDTNEEIARESFESGSWIADKNPEHFFEMHKDAWREKWERGGVDLSGDIKLEKLAYSSLYYILSSLPSTDSHRGMNDFGGVSAGGLAQGGASEPTKGHVSWNQERWILPAILPFHPSLVKTMINYRNSTRPAARMSAERRGYEGVLFSWNSAASGIDVTPRYDPRNHFHLNGDIAFAIRQYMAMTQDRLWAQEHGLCSLIRELAQFWFSKLKWNEETKHYDIIDVTQQDGLQGAVNNSIYTNVLASLALHYSKYAACLCNIDVNTYAPQEWIHAAQNIHWEYNSSLNYNPEYQGYITTGIDKAIKQSGAVMLGYPLMWGLSQTNLDRNLQHYRSVLPDSSPSTAWSMLAINELENGKESLAQDAFHKSYKDYVKEPFKTWTEYPNGGQSTDLSGMGAYLQTLIYGYGGLRIHLEYLYMNPRLPEGVHSMILRDIDYLGSRIDVRVTSVLVHISVRSIGVYPLMLTVTDSAKVYYLTRGASIPIQRGPFTIKSKVASGCPLPDDNILPYATKSPYTPASHLGNSGSSGRVKYHKIFIYTLLFISLLPFVH